MKRKTVFRCQSCGETYAKWQGQCTNCSEWNTLIEEERTTRGAAGKPASTSNAKVESLNSEAPRLERVSSGLPEMDRVLGGGFVPGSAIMLGGDPGIGKSTLLLQALSAMADAGRRCLYDSGEESTEQIRRRAQRLGVLSADLGITNTDDADAVAELMRLRPTPDILVVDSVQMLTSAGVDAAAGSPSQMRACARTLIQAAKTSGTALVLVGHVTKDSAIAGPKQIEHMVDAVLRFDQEADASFRVLRGTKNRFGSVDEVGVFEMTEEGMREVANPSEAFLHDRRADVSGSAILPNVEGSRPILVETQTLVAPSQYGTPRRTVVGCDQNRLAMIVAVLHARCGLNICESDIYLNISGGLRVTEPAADLAVAAALVSATVGHPLPAGTAWFGEIGLGGEVRSVPRPEQRIREAAKMGFTHVVCPRDRGRAVHGGADPACRVQHVDSLVEIVSTISLEDGV